MRGYLSGCLCGHALEYVFGYVSEYEYGQPEGQYLCGRPVGWLRLPVQRGGPGVQAPRHRAWRRTRHWLAGWLADQER